MKQKLKHLLENIPVLDSLYASIRRSKARRKFWMQTGEDEQRLKFYRQFIEPGDVVFDVGANLGNRTKAFLLLGADVVAFEPQKRCMEYLENVLEGRKGVKLVSKALGDKPGWAEMMVSNAHVLSTLSTEWVEATRESGRFSKYQWNERQQVEIVTLDSRIELYGMPSFVKIDVEGFEYQVISGLSRPVPSMSIEFTAEHIESTYRCIDHMDALGQAAFQISRGESMEFDLPSWVSAAQAKETLEEFISNDKMVWGDMYIRCSNIAS